MREQNLAVIITNNPLIKAVEGAEVRYRCASVLTIMQEAKQLVYRGYKLLNHPLSGNWQMNVSPYKTMFLKQGSEELDASSVFAIEKCILWLEQLSTSSRLPEEWPAEVLYDLQLIDKDIFNNTIKKIYTMSDTL